MTTGPSSLLLHENEEISALIATLHQTEQRLEELTSGEVDTVSDPEGRILFLRQAQEQLRHIEAAKQAAILNALPAHIALLDSQGVILSVNQAWRRFAGENLLLGSGCGIGLNYLNICDNAFGDRSPEARQVAEGIRAVLHGAVKTFSMEYPCHSPTEQRWFLLTATPLVDDRLHGVVVTHLDVSSERQAEESLRVSESRFRQMAESISDVFCLVDMVSGRMLYVNPAYEGLSGRSCESLYTNPESWINSVHPDDRPSIFEKYKAAMSSGTLEFECRVMRPEGSIRWMEVRGFPIRDGTGTLVRMAGVAKDITERKQAVAALANSETRLRALLENSSDIIAITAVDGRLLYVSPSIERVGGYEPNEIVGLGFLDLVHPDDRAAAIVEFKEMVRHPGVTYRVERRYRHKSGNWIASENIAINLMHVPAIAGIVTTMRDVTERNRVMLELRESERRFSDLLGNIELLSVMLDNDGLITYCNQYLLRLTGWSIDEVIGRDWFELFMPPDVGNMRPVFEKPLSSLPVAFHREGEIKTRSGARRLIRWNRSVLRSVAGAVIGTASIGEDITESRAAEAKLAYLNRVYAVLSGINTLIVHARDRDELFREACRIAVESGGFRMALIGVVDRITQRIVPTASAGVDDDLMAEIKSVVASAGGGPHTMEERAVLDKKMLVSNEMQDSSSLLLGNKYFEYGVRSMAVLPLIVASEAVGVLALYASEAEFFHEEELKLLTGLAGDIAYATENMQKADKLNYLAYYDELTGLANRNLFLERVDQYIRSAFKDGHKLAVCMIDLERFKNINDALGQLAGDALLKQVAVWLNRFSGDPNLLARVGADHFAVVIPKITREGNVARVIEKATRDFMGHPFALANSVFRVSAKTGIAIYPEDGPDAGSLFRNAEAALKKAKASGHRFLFYTEKMTEMIAIRLTLENQLREAFEKEEFVLHYQPKVNLASGKVTSAEALIRWNDPRTGLVPPGQFIPVLEDTGLIREVGRWVLHKVIEDSLRWRRAGLDGVRISVNVSPLQLRNEDFIDDIRQAIAVDPHAAEALELEITENLIMEDISRSIASLQAIRDMGIHIAIDDFGTGFSSLSYLTKLPLDTLKIDRSFVTGMSKGPQELALVSTIITIAHSLSLNVVAEGVETHEQLRQLRQLNCDEMQGYLFSQAVPADFFEIRYLAMRSLADKP